MQTKTYNVYKFKELPKEAQQKALDNLRNINVDYDDWHRFILEDKKTELEALGYNDVKIYYSGFWSQGDGACFIAKSIDIQKWLKAHKLVKKYSKLADLADITGSITHNNQYYYSTSTTVNIDANNEYTNQYNGKDFTVATRNAIEDCRQFLEKAIEKEREKQGDELYKYLQQCYEDDQTDEAVRETMEANDYDFTIDGKIDPA